MRERQVHIIMFIKSRSTCFTRVLFREKEKRFFTEHREIRDFLELHADHATQGEKGALTKLYCEVAC